LIFGVDPRLAKHLILPFPRFYEPPISRAIALPVVPISLDLDSPDFNPIEMAFSKLKALLRKAAARTKDDLWDAIAKAIDTFTPTECENYFAAAGYERD
jgi:hypothetical protein